MWREFLELEPQLKAMLGEKERGGVAFKVSGCCGRHCPSEDSMFYFEGAAESFHICYLYVLIVA